MTAGEAYNVAVAAIIATTVVQESDSDKLTYYGGTIEDHPLRERHFTLVPLGNDRLTTRMGCREWTIPLELLVLYQTSTEGWAQRMLDDGKAIADTLVLLIQIAGITQIVEIDTDNRYLDRYVITSREFEMTYSETL